MKLDYDDATAVQMLAALRDCPARYRLDTLAAVCKAVIEGDLLHVWPDDAGVPDTPPACPHCGRAESEHPGGVYCPAGVPDTPPGWTLLDSLTPCRDCGRPTRRAHEGRAWCSLCRGPDETAGVPDTEKAEP